MDAHSDLRSVGEAAQELGLSRERVHALIEAGELPAVAVGVRGRFVAAADIRRFAGQARSPGRPLSPSHALALLWVVSGEEPAWLDRVELWKVRKIAKSLDGPKALVAKVRRRARRLDLEVLTEDLPHIRSEPGLVRSGLSSTAEHHIDLVAGGAVEGYLDQELLNVLLAQYSPANSRRPNLILRIVDDHAPLVGRLAMPWAAVLADLTEDDDPRSREAVRLAWDERWPS